MIVKSIAFKNFRNIVDEKIIFSDNMNVICGENAQGKTNILEGIWLFTGAKSFRGGKENGYVKFGAEIGKTELLFVSGGVENTAKLEFTDKKKAFLNEKPLKSPQELAGNFNAVVFSPTDLSIVVDGPEKRRRFLDVSIGQIYPQYIDYLREYLRAVKQRNEIIKEYKFDATVEIMLDSFEEKIAECGEKIIKYRTEYIDVLSNYLPEIYNGLSGGREEIMSVYVANVCANMLKEKLKAARATDKFTGTTSVGPHKDDIEFTVNGINARQFGSQGQKRSVAIALKLSGAEVIKEKVGEYPVCLLDDVMSELDEKRQNYILNHIKGRQSFITVCDPASVSRLESGNVITVNNGRVK